MPKAVVHSDSHSFGWVAEVTTDRKHKPVVLLYLVDIVSGAVPTNKRFVAKLPVRRARKLAQWILDNTEES